MRWISMLSLSKCVLSEYCTLLVKMYSAKFVKATILAAKVSIELLADIMCNLLSLAATTPLVEDVTNLVVFA